MCKKVESAFFQWFFPRGVLSRGLFSRGVLSGIQNGIVKTRSKQMESNLFCTRKKLPEL